MSEDVNVPGPPRDVGEGLPRGRRRREARVLEILATGS